MHKYDIYHVIKCISLVTWHDIRWAIFHADFVMPYIIIKFKNTRSQNKNKNWFSWTLVLYIPGGTSPDFSQTRDSFLDRWLIGLPVYIFLYLGCFLRSSGPSTLMHDRSLWTSNNYWIFRYDICAKCQSLNACFITITSISDIICICGKS